MPRLVKAAAGVRGLALPSGKVLSANQTSVVSDADWTLLSGTPGMVGGLLLDQGASTAEPDTANLGGGVATDVEVARIIAAERAHAKATFGRALTRQVVAYLGDSLTPASTYAYGTAPHWAAVARALLGHRYDDGVLAGVGGQTSTQIAARVGTVAASQPSICIVHAGANDLPTGTPAATVIANLQTIIDALVRAGIKPVLLTVIPSSSINTAAELLEAAKVNNWIKALPATHGVHSIDWRAAVVDFASTTAAWTAAWSGDGVHPNDLGHTVLGRAVADGLAPLIVGPSPLVSDAAAGSGLLTLNPGMMGTGGTGGTGITGTIPASWTLTPNATVTVASSTEARTDGVGGNWWKLDFTAGSAYTFQQNTAVGVDWNVGDTVWFEAEVLISGTPTNFRGLQASLEFWNGLGGVNDFTLQQASGVTSPIRGDARPYVLRTKPTVVPAGTARLQGRLYANQSVASIGATVRIGRSGIRKAI